MFEPAYSSPLLCDVFIEEVSGTEGQLKGAAVSNEKDAAGDNVPRDTNANEKALVITNNAPATLSPVGEIGRGEPPSASSNETKPGSEETAEKGS